MNPPAELQQIDTLHSVALNPYVDAVSQPLVSNIFSTGFGNTLKNFWLLLPDYIVLFMAKIFSFSFFLSLVLVILIIWCSNKILNFQDRMHSALVLPSDDSVADDGEGKTNKIVNEKWQRVIVHINSENPSDWKLAILECDIMLSEILEKLGYMQESIGEKLKAVEASDMTNIESAWEAHKIRNTIAHEGSEFLINEREAKRVIGLYELVFREFDFI